MTIKKVVVLKILEYLRKNEDFYFPFLIFCEELKSGGSDCAEISVNDFKKIKNVKYKNFKLVENLQHLKRGTTKLMSKGFLEKITGESLEKHIAILAKNYRKEWKLKLCESEGIEEYGLNEFIGGKAEAYKDCLELIKSFSYN